MDAIRRYVMTLTAAAMLCALVKAVTAGRKGQEKILGLVCGIFLLATALGPLGLIRLPDLSDPTAQARMEASQAAGQAEAETKRQMTAIISEEAATYILDKADALGLQLEAGGVGRESPALGRQPAGSGFALCKKPPEQPD